jgi:hypothetical protein
MNTGLWRGAAERVTWLRDVRRTSITLCAGTAAFAALLLVDRASMLVRRLMRDAGLLR